MGGASGVRARCEEERRFPGGAARVSERPAAGWQGAGWLLGAWTFLVMVFLYLPIAILIGFSFNTSRLNILWEGFTLKWYSAVWNDTVLIRSLQNSLYVASISTVLSVALGVTGLIFGLAVMRLAA